MATITEKLGVRIKHLRKIKGMTQEELAFQSGIDYSYLNEIEAGKRNPSIKRIAGIAKALGVKPSELLS